MVDVLNTPERHLAVTYLANRPSSRLTELLLSPSPQTRQATAQLLLRWGGQGNRQAVLEAFVAGKLGNGLPGFRADVSEQRWLKQQPPSPRLIALLIHSLTSPRDKLLWEFRHDLREEELARQMAAFPTDLLLDFFAGDLTTALPYLRLHGTVPRKLVALLESEPDRLLPILEKSRRLSGPGLDEVLLRLAGRNQALSLRARTRPDSGAHFRASLEPFLNHPCGVKALIDGVAHLTAAEQVRTLRDIDAARNRLTELYLENPSLKAELPESVLTATLEMTQDRDPERARRAIRLVLLDQEEFAVEVLEKALEHPHSRVRSLAHRALKGRVSAEHYLDATMTLLRDPLPDFRRRAVRVLSYARFLPAVPAIARLLRDKHTAVRRVAREGLLYFGSVTLPA